MSTIVKKQYDLGGVHFVELGDSREGVIETKSFYVSLVADLNGCYLRFQAQSIHAVEQYLQREYLRGNTWKLPWCAVYDTEPTKPQWTRAEGAAPIIIDALCGPLFEAEADR